MKRIGCLWLCCFLSGLLFAQSPFGPKVLIVSAHPDDETTFPVVVYKIAHDLNGIADLALLTDGQGGYRSTELASQYYGLNLTDSVIGRAYLPAIRKRELMAAGTIMGLRNYFFFDQIDDFHSGDPAPYLNGTRWDAPMISKKLDAILARTAYDFVFVLLPHAGQHAHHKTATLLALQAVQRMKGNNKPIVLGGYELNKKDTASFRFTELPNYPETRIRSGAPRFHFDRRARFGYDSLLNYMVVHDWVLAEYKSQGDTQANDGWRDLETFWYFDLNGAAGLPKTRKLFDDLKRSGFPTK